MFSQHILREQMHGKTIHRLFVMFFVIRVLVDGRCIRKFVYLKPASKSTVLIYFANYLINIEDFRTKTRRQQRANYKFLFVWKLCLQSIMCCSSSSEKFALHSSLVSYDVFHGNGFHK